MNEVPETRFLITTVTVNEGVSAVFTIAEDLEPEELRLRLDYQIRRLELNDRYCDEINVFLNSQKVALSLIYGVDHDAVKVKEYLLRAAESHAIDFGNNDWRTALLYGLADSDPFCEGGFELALGLPAS